MRSTVAAMFATFAALTASQAGAGSLQVEPVLVDVAAPGAASTVTLRNEGATPIDAQIRIYRWSLVNGKERLEPTDDVVASPPSVTLTPKGQYIARIVRVSKQPVVGEENYRLLIDQLPDLFQQRNGAVNLMVRYSIPVFFGAASKKSPSVAWSVATNGDKNTVTVFEGRTNKIVGSISVGNMPDASVYDPSTRLVAVMNHRGGTVSLVDASKVTVVKTITVGGELEAAAASGDGQLFVNVANKHEVAVLDLAAGKVLRRLGLKGCEDPSGIAYDAAGGLLASVCGNGVTKILHAADGAEVASLKTGLGSDGLIFDPTRKLLFVPAGKAGTLTVITLSADSAPKVLQTVKTAVSARLGALDAKTGRLYLPSAKLGPPVPPDPWPSVVPGTFVFLVVGER